MNSSIAGVWVRAEKPPEIGEYVFVLVGTDIIFKGRLMYNGWTAFFSDGEKLVGEERPVTHWMPLPNLPQDESQPIPEIKWGQIKVCFDGPYSVENGRQEFVAFIKEFPGMVESGKTKEEAFRELMISLQIKFAYDAGIKTPIPVNQDELWEKVINEVAPETARFSRDKYIDTINELKSKYALQLKSNPEPIPVQEGLRWSAEDIETLIRCCWNAAREREIPPYIETLEDLIKLITPPAPPKDQIDFKHHFKVIIGLMEKYCWFYNWSTEFLQNFTQSPVHPEKKEK